MPIKLKPKQLSDASEKRAVLLYKGRQQIASGALHHSKGDVLTGRFLIEDKITERRSFSVTEELLLKARKEAYQHRRTALFRVTVGKATYVTLHEEDFLALLNQLPE